MFDVRIRSDFRPARNWPASEMFSLKFCLYLKSVLASECNLQNLYSFASSPSEIPLYTVLVCFLPSYVMQYITYLANICYITWIYDSTVYKYSIAGYSDGALQLASGWLLFLKIYMYYVHLSYISCYITHLLLYLLLYYKSVQYLEPALAGTAWGPPAACPPSVRTAVPAIKDANFLC